MPIRSIPFDQITADHARDLIERKIREGPTLDFKQQLKLDDSGKLDLLGDVTAMANAVGGTIIYGAVEGEGEDRGLIVDVNGVEPRCLLSGYGRRAVETDTGVALIRPGCR
jgi:hypothetical protein